MDLCDKSTELPENQLKSLRLKKIAILSTGKQVTPTVLLSS